ncbi:MAG: anti-sigma factor [Chitinophagales bacterium]
MSSITLKNEAKKYKFILGIAIILIIISKCLLFYYYTQYKNITQALISEKQANLKLVQQFNDSQRLNQDGTVEQLVVLRDSNSKVIRMVAFNDAQEGVASIYWDTETQKVFLDVLNLPAPPNDKDYHLWAIKEGQSMDVGIVKIDEGMQQLKDVADADSFVVTLEEGENVQQPNKQYYFLKAVVDKNS